jgi:hypothetical protein
MRLGAILRLSLFVTVSCPGPAKPLPSGAIPCQSVDDCPDQDNWICGFSGVDTPPQCIWSPGPQSQQERNPYDAAPGKP